MKKRTIPYIADCILIASLVGIALLYGWKLAVLILIVGACNNYLQTQKPK